MLALLEHLLLVSPHRIYFRNGLVGLISVLIHQVPDVAEAVDLRGVGYGGQVLLDLGLLHFALHLRYLPGGLRHLLLHQPELGDRFLPAPLRVAEHPLGVLGVIAPHQRTALQHLGQLRGGTCSVTDLRAHLLDVLEEVGVLALLGSELALEERALLAHHPDVGVGLYELALLEQALQLVVLDLGYLLRETAAHRRCKLLHAALECGQLFAGRLEGDHSRLVLIDLRLQLSLLLLARA